MFGGFCGLFWGIVLSRIKMYGISEKEKKQNRYKSNVRHKSVKNELKQGA